MEQLLKLGEVADALGVSLSTVERLVRSGEFSGGLVRFRGNTRITSAAVDKFVSRHLDGDEEGVEKSLRGPTVRSENRPMFGEMTDDDSAKPTTYRRHARPERTVADALVRARKGSGS